MDDVTPACADFAAAVTDREGGANEIATRDVLLARRAEDSVPPAADEATAEAEAESITETERWRLREAVPSALPVVLVRLEPVPSAVGLSDTMSGGTATTLCLTGFSRWPVGDTSDDDEEDNEEDDKGPPAVELVMPPKPEDRVG